MKTTATTIKTLLCFAAASLFVVGCAKDEVSNTNISAANVLGIDVSTGKTRANLANLDTLKRNGIGIFATNGALGETFINNKAYIFEGEWKWSGADILWPSSNEEYPINFYAYYPTGNTSLNPSLLDLYIIAATPGEQEDFLAANHLNVVTRPISSNVSLAFKHILSKIDFKVLTGLSVTVEVQSVAVRNVGGAGMFNYANLTWSEAPISQAEAPAGSWNANYSYMRAPLNVANKFAGATTAAKVQGSHGSLMLLPQALSGRAWDETAGNIPSQSYIEVVYRIYETSNGEDVVGYTNATQYPGGGNGVTGPLFVKVGYSLSTTWLMGKAYTYTINLGTANDSGGDLIAENFVDKDGNDSGLPVIDPATKEAINVPEPIFPDRPIGFIVSVDDWGAEENIPIK